MIHASAQPMIEPIAQSAFAQSGSVFSLRDVAALAVGRLDAKRLLDVVFALIALVVLSPLFLIVAVLIKLTSPGKVFYTPLRVGRNCTSFKFYKFRSMRTDTHREREELIAGNSHGQDSITFKLKRDPRTTWIGRILRKTSIDELPQLWNVLKGDMSLVGPRPPIHEEVSRYSTEHFARLSVLPGITCFWQVYGRANLSFEKQFELDLQYIENRTLLLDIKLLILTVPAVISGKGAY